MADIITTFVRSLIVILTVQSILAAPAPARICKQTKKDIRLYYDEKTNTYSKEAMSGVVPWYSEVYVCEGNEPNFIVESNRFICKQDFIYLGESRLPLEVSCSVRIVKHSDNAL